MDPMNLVGALDETGGDGIDVDALAREDGHEALGLKPDEGVAQGSLAHLKGFADAVHPEIRRSAACPRSWRP